jgi:hypothetical protein
MLGLEGITYVGFLVTGGVFGIWTKDTRTLLAIRVYLDILMIFQGFIGALKHIANETEYTLTSKPMSVKLYLEFLSCLNITPSLVSLTTLTNMSVHPLLVQMVISKELLGDVNMI